MYNYDICTVRPLVLKFTSPTQSPSSISGMSCALCVCLLTYENIMFKMLSSHCPLMLETVPSHLHRNEKLLKLLVLWIRMLFPRDDPLVYVLFIYSI